MANLTCGSRLGRYQIVRLLATGGMADVYLARDLVRGGEVAVKTLAHASDEMRALFFDEARVGALMDHPNVARVHAAGTASGVDYLAMDYVRGLDLGELASALAAQGRTLPYATAVAITAAAAAGLDHAHRRCQPDGTPLQLVHRDVSLSNIMVTVDGQVKVIDFGIAQADGAAHETAPGIVRGKAAYMSPEQCVGERVDLRTDVFALGVVLYELTTGRRCFAGESVFQCMLSILQGEYVLPSMWIAGFPPELEHVIVTALAQDPSRRYASAAHLIAALRALGYGHGCVSGTLAIARLVGELSRETPPVHATELATLRQLPAHLRPVDDDARTLRRRALPRPRACMAA